MATPDKQETLVHAIRHRLESLVEATPIGDQEWIIRTPFYDPSGDPISVTVSQENGTIVVDDGGVIAGQLFSLGQHTQDTPAFKLLTALTKTYDLDIDYDSGMVKSSVPSELFLDGFMDLMKVIVTVITVSPHVRVKPHRMTALGPRLRRRIRETYQQKNILKLVEPDHEIRGSTVEAWPVDFHWQVGQNGERKDVFVLAADLDTQDPLRKAQRLSALAIDTKSVRSTNDLRVVIDTHGMDEDSKTAAHFIKQHSESLAYKVFDFGDDIARTTFINQSVEELLGEQGREWRNFWVQSR